jgi:signal transduction histidine kinase
MFGCRKDSTEFPFFVSLSPLKTPDGILTSAVVRDLTETRKLEAQVLRVKRIESVGAFAGNIAHDLNNALAPVVMSLDLLKRLYPESHELVSAIESGASRGAEMLRQLLAFSKGSFVEPKRVSSFEVAKELKRTVSAMLPSNIALSVGCDPETLPMRGDPTQIHQVLMNLCANAKDAMRDAPGKLSVRALNVEFHKASTNIHPQMNPGIYVKWEVEDTGPGMEADMLDRIFEPFFTTKPIGKGTGLGLSIVSEISDPMMDFCTRIPPQVEDPHLAFTFPWTKPMNRQQKVTAKNLYPGCRAAEEGFSWSTIHPDCASPPNSF